MGNWRNQKLSDHPNYEVKFPKDGESIICFALRCAAHLMSPPQEDDESHEVESACAASQIISIGESLQSIWDSQWCYCGNIHGLSGKHRKTDNCYESSIRSGDDVLTGQHKLRSTDYFSSDTNYENEFPVEGESKIEFALRCAAGLIYRRGQDNQVHEKECIDVADKMIKLEKYVQRSWDSSWCYCNYGGVPGYKHRKSGSCYYGSTGSADRILSGKCGVRIQDYL